MAQLKNWWQSGLVCLIAFMALVAIEALWTDSVLPFRWQFRMWWEAGGFVTLGSVVVGYLTLQVVAGGNLGPRVFWSRGTILLLVPFLLAGSCTSDAYQHAAALGAFGLSSERSVVIVGKRSAVDQYVVGSGPDRDYEYYDTYELVFSNPEWGVVEWEHADGSVALADELPVSEETFKQHKVGASIHVVELPGARYSPWRLAADARAAVRTSLQGAVLWLLLSLLTVWAARNQLLEHQEPPS